MMDIVIREATITDTDALAQVLITAMQSAFRGLVPDYCLEWPDSAANWKRTLTNGLDDGVLLRVAAAGINGVMAYAMAGRSTHAPGYEGELYQLHVMPDYQRQGIGRLLVRDAVTQLSGQGINSLCVRVLKDNPNRPFYERLGGQFISEQPYDWDGVVLPEYTYGWKDARQIITD